MIELYISGRYTGVYVGQDERYPGMWRIHSAGTVSDMVNLSRAKDAAVAWARPRGLGGSETISWRRRETAPGTSPMRSGSLAATTPPEAA